MCTLVLKKGSLLFLTFTTDCSVSLLPLSVAKTKPLLLRFLINLPSFFFPYLLYGNLHNIAVEM